MGRKPTAGFDAKAFLTKAGTGRSVAAYRKKHVIFAQGDPADAVFYLEKGQVTLTGVSDRGKSGVVAMLGPGDFFGEGCLAGQPLRMATALAMTEASVVRVERQRSGCSTSGRSSPSASWRTCWPAMCASRKIWWISCSTRARNGWLGKGER